MCLRAWACQLAIVLAISGVVASETAQARRSPAEAGAEQEPPGKEEKPQAPKKVVVTSPLVTDVDVTQRYAGLIRSQRHIEVRALVTGYIAEIPVKEGQAVKRGDVLFQMSPVLQKAKLEAELAKVKVAKLKLNHAKELFEQKAANQREVTLYEAELSLAEANAKVAEAELSFTTVHAPYDGLLGRFQKQEGSLVKMDDTLTTLSDNSVMWVYFNVPEARYLEYKTRPGGGQNPSRLELAGARIELVLANDSTFKHDAGNTVTIEGRFNNETGNISIRADFPNPDRLLRHGQTGTVVIRQPLKNATVVPQRATFEVLNKRYAYVVDKGGEVRRREIVVQHEIDDLFVIKRGLDASDRIVLDGVRRVSDGDKVEYEFRDPEDAIGRPKTDRKK